MNVHRSRIAAIEDEKQQARVLIVDAGRRVIAASDDKGLLEETYALDCSGGPRGFYTKNDKLVAYALTPGYETYKGPGWYGVIETAARSRRQAAPHCCCTRTVISALFAVLRAPRPG